MKSNILTKLTTIVTETGLENLQPKISRLGLLSASLLSSITMFNNNAFASTIVDTLEDIGPIGTVVNLRTINGVQVSISPSGGFDMLANTYFDDTSLAFGGAGQQVNVPLNPSNVSQTRFISTLTNNGFAGTLSEVVPITFAFSEPVMGFGFTTVDLLESGSNPAASITVSAFDASNSLIDSQTRTGIQGSSGLDLDWFVSSQFNDILSVTLSSENIPFGAGYGIDDIVLSSNTPAQDIPEGSNVLALGASALLGIFTLKKPKDEPTPKPVKVER